VQNRLIQTIRIKIYNKRLGQIQHMCPFKCCHSQLYLPITTVSAHISKFRSEYVWKCIYSQLTETVHLHATHTYRWK